MSTTGSPGTASPGGRKPVTRHGSILAGMVLGAALGTLCQMALAGPALEWAIENVTRPLGQIFLRSLFMLVVPLLFSALVIGVSELELGQVGKLGARLLAYTAVMSAVAVGLGVLLVNTVGPGRGLPGELVSKVAAVPSAAASGPKTDPVEFFISLVPDNPVKAAANGDMLALIVFSLVFGLALAGLRSETAGTLKGAITGLYEVMTRLIDGVLYFAPLGVAALMFTLTARLGYAILVQLGAYVGVVLFGLAVHMFVVYSISVRFWGGMNPVAFFRGVRTAMLVAFSTASSSATLPTALRVAEENLKLPKDVSRFVLTAGSAMNQNGTALFEGVTVLFIAQVFDVQLGLMEQVLVMVICVLGGIGTAGVPAGSLPVIALILGMFGIPPEGLGLVLGVDRLLDMCRTVLNVTGDLAAAVFVGRHAKTGTAPP